MIRQDQLIRTETTTTRAIVRPALLAGWLVAFAIAAAVADPAEAPAPRRLSETGLFVAGTVERIAPAVLPFSPQYPLWSDGTTKRRWIRLPPGTAIDATRPDDWAFPVGTRLWKEFSFDRRIETRMSERLRDGSWRFAVYIWKEDGSDAELGPAAGIRALPVASAPGGRYTVPSRGDCAACHEGGAVPVLGFGALQLSTDRDPLAPHAAPKAPGEIDLRDLAARGLVRNLPPALLDRPPRIASASPAGRAVLGYLHGNCGHCHSDPRDADGAVPLDLILKQYVARPDSAATVRASVVSAASRFRARDAHASARADILMLRMRSRDPRVQMPPLGTRVHDSTALSLIERWVSTDLATTKEKQP